MQVIKSCKELQEFVDSKNGFHDWFLKRLEFISYDSIDDAQSPGRILSERLDVQLVFGSSRPGEPGKKLNDSTVTLKGARGISVFFPQRDGAVFSDWGVNTVEILEEKAGRIRFRVISSIYKAVTWSPITLIDVPFEIAEII